MITKILLTALFIGGTLLSVFAQNNTGKTYTIQAEDLESAPFFSVVSKDKETGETLFSSYLYVKGKLNGLYDISGGLQNNDTFVLNNVNVWDDDDRNRFSMDLRQSQLRLQVRKKTGKGDFIGYVEGDFNGSSSNLFRLRQIWMDFMFLHIGQDWSAFGDKDLWPNTLDWDGAPSGIWVRNPQIRFYYAKNSNLYEFSIENPDPEIMFNNDIDSTIMSDFQTMPDFIFSYKRSGKFGHFKFASIIRSLQSLVGNSKERTVGYGFALSAAIKTHQERADILQLQLIGGEGIANYFISFAGFNYDAVITQEGNIEAVPVVGGFIAYELWLGSQWHTNFVLGSSYLNSPKIATYFIPDIGYTATNSSLDLGIHYGLINLMYDIRNNITFGLEGVFGLKTVDHRGQLTDEEDITNKLEEQRDAIRLNFGVFFQF